MVPHLKKAWILVLLPVFLGLVSCPFSPDKTGGPPDDPVVTEYKPQVTISNVLHNLKLAYEQMKYEEYAKLLDDSFRFRFDPRDVGEDKPWGEAEWGKGEELDSARNMFGGQPNLNGLIVDRIKLTFEPGTPEPSVENDQWQQVLLTAVDLKLEATEQLTGDEWTIQTPGNYEALFHFIQTDEIDPGTSANIWKIAMWVDKPPQGKRTLLAQD